MYGLAISAGGEQELFLRTRRLRLRWGPVMCMQASEPCNGRRASSHAFGGLVEQVSAAGSQRKRNARIATKEVADAPEYGTKPFHTAFTSLALLRLACTSSAGMASVA